jgi:hypothetical protein
MGDLFVSVYNDQQYFMYRKKEEPRSNDQCVGCR